MPPDHVRTYIVRCPSCEKVYDRRSSLRSHIYHYHPDKLILCFTCISKLVRSIPRANTSAEDTFNEHDLAFNNNMIRQTRRRLRRKAFDKNKKNQPTENIEFAVCSSCKGLFYTKKKDTENVDGTRNQELMGSSDENPRDLQHNSQVFQNPSDEVLQNPSNEVLQNPSNEVLQNPSDDVLQNPIDYADVNQRTFPNPRDLTNENPQIHSQNPNRNPRFPENERFSQDLCSQSNVNKPLTHDPGLQGNENASRYYLWLPHDNNLWTYDKKNPQDENIRVPPNSRDHPNSYPQIPRDRQNLDSNRKLPVNLECLPDQKTRFSGDPWLLPNESIKLSQDPWLHPGIDGNENKSPSQDPWLHPGIDGNESKSLSLDPNSVPQTNENQRVSLNPWTCPNENLQASRDSKNQDGNPSIPEYQVHPPDQSKRFFQDQWFHPIGSNAPSEDPWFKPWAQPNKKNPLTEDHLWFPHDNIPLVHQDTSDHREENQSPCKDPRALKDESQRLHQDAQMQLEMNQRFSQNLLVFRENNTSTHIRYPSTSTDHTFVENDNPSAVQETELKCNDLSLDSDIPFDCIKDLLECEEVPLSPDKDPLVSPVRNLRMRIDPLYRPAVNPGISLNRMLRPTFNPRMCFNPLYCFRLNQRSSGQNLSPNLN